ncbi:type II toxin-antitoxin system prevent-host-death family antitoxin [Methylobacterium oryzihabitans]|uniref:Antitoxin n=1 Tax=Methylobacterium oryzihabitans TaxID=2499852 RepID=A0A3S2VLL5_9HYPH|nr:type II toxin-antitoxin system prevent-host-death family antitoxin [Methylobacterium oryzihabitans]RVU15642.1 type II toxin-antitoxin system prevent-host-death family antitoxin [Methylobacterium oryzihabitans]
MKPAALPSHPLHKARAELSALVERALAGEPQRITRTPREAVVMVSEAEWEGRQAQPGTLAALFLAHAGEDGEAGYAAILPSGS